jgi:hypothetical protein
MSDVFFTFRYFRSIQIKMGEHEAVPADIQKTLVGWKKHFNAYTQTGRFNVIMSLGFMN